jgi:murein DD-endopeptidase MepM/ murein hydrolase activator NlpD
MHKTTQHQSENSAKKQLNQTNSESSIPLIRMCCPTLSPMGKYLNLEQVIGPLKRERLIDARFPMQYQQAIQTIHKTYHVQWSYGGWLEDRSQLWAGTYITSSKKTLHVGIDINAPKNTPIHSPGKGIVTKIECDQGDEIDWGTSISVDYGKYTMIFAHLSPKVEINEGQVIQANQKIGEIGTWPKNGNVFEHLHIQSMQTAIYEKHLLEKFENLDGYVIPQTEHGFTNPLTVLAEIRKKLPKKSYVI